MTRKGRAESEWQWDGYNSQHYGVGELISPPIPVLLCPATEILIKSIIFWTIFFLNVYDHFSTDENIARKTLNFCIWIT